MADPLSITASVAGIVVPALHGIRLLLCDLQQIKNSPEDINILKDKINLLELALASLNAIDEGQWRSLGSTVADEAKSTVNICATSCEKFRVDIQRWTRHSHGQTLSLRDRCKIGFWKQDYIKSVLGQLQNCQVSISSVVSIATLYVLPKAGHQGIHCADNCN